MTTILQLRHKKTGVTREVFRTEKTAEADFAICQLKFFSVIVGGRIYSHYPQKHTEGVQAEHLNPPISNEWEVSLVQTTPNENVPAIHFNRNDTVGPLVAED